MGRSYFAWLASIAALACALQATACSSDPASPGGAAGSASGGVGGSAGGGAAGSASGGAPSGAADAVVGSFIVQLFGATDTATGYTTFLGKVYDGVTPSAVLWDTLSSAEGCVLLKPRVPFCTTACDNGSVCAADEQCVVNPSAQDLGPLLLKGLGPADITLKPIASVYQLPGDVTLPYPPVDAGAPLSLSVTGGPFGAFSLETKMVEPLVSAGGLNLETGQPLTLSWDAPADATLARIQIKIDISHHAGSKGKIECDVADTGSLEIPASLISGLITLGVAEAPSLTLSRVSSGSTAIAPGQVTFQVISSAVREVAVVGG